MSKNMLDNSNYYCDYDIILLRTQTRDNSKTQALIE